MKTIYIETSIPSFYYEVRIQPDMIARRDWTREWWDIVFGQEELVIGPPVLGELEKGTFPGKSDALALVKNLPLLQITPGVLEIVEAYLAHKLMPSDPAGDVLHLALASYHKCDFLVTWNCKHLANANKFGHIRRLNGILGVSVPTLITPLELLGENA